MGTQVWLCKVSWCEDVQRIQCELDSIKIGSTKLHVNTPRFEMKGRLNRAQKSISPLTNKTPKIRPV